MMRIAKRVGRTLFFIVLLLSLVVLTVWASLAIWFRLPAPETVRLICAGLFSLFGIAVIVLQFSRWQLRALGTYVASYAVLLIWWGTIDPPAQGNWAPGVRKQVTGQFDEDQLVLTNIREFEWQPDGTAKEIWTTQSFDLSQLNSVDMFLSYWAGPEMAHFILSFGFTDGRYLAWSVEVRREIGGGFSPVADFFKTNTLAIVATVEKDVVGVRSNIRKESVYLFRLRTSPEAARKLLKEYVRDANALAVRPKFYNSITTNCTTVVFRMMTAVGGKIPFDWRMIVNGYLPEYAYDRGALDTRKTISELRKIGHINTRAQANGLNDAFSSAIRQGVPVPGR